MAYIKVLFIILFTLGFCNLADGVIITRLYVPGRASHEAPMECKYDLQNEQLYDVKWYKDGEQFYRCLPNGEIMQYPVEGVNITRTEFAPIGSCTVTLMMLNSKSEGEYKCEVSTEAPVFKTAVKSSKLRIIEIAKKIQNNTTLRQDPHSSIENDTTNIATNSATNINIYSIVAYLLCAPLYYINFR